MQKPQATWLDIPHAEILYKGWRYQNYRWFGEGCRRSRIVEKILRRLGSEGNDKKNLWQFNKIG
jgi:hypothetical protein